MNPDYYTICAITVFAIFAVVGAIKWGIWKNRFQRLNIEHLDTILYLNASQSTAREFLNSARLIAIDRNGRINTFTFMRNDTTFTIETMGLLGDDVEGWRMKAGISNV